MDFDRLVLLFELWLDEAVRDLVESYSEGVRFKIDELAKSDCGLLVKGNVLEAYLDELGEFFFEKWG